MEIKRSLKIRRKMKRRKPKFQRQEGPIVKTLKNSWRRPKGRHSKLRQREKARGRLPKAGYGSPKNARGLTRSGLKQVRISNAGQLRTINPKTHAVVIAGSVGSRKRGEIKSEAKKSGIAVMN